MDWSRPPTRTRNFDLNKEGSIRWRGELHQKECTSRHTYIKESTIGPNHRSGNLVVVAMLAIGRHEASRWVSRAREYVRGGWGKVGGDSGLKGGIIVVKNEGGRRGEDGYVEGRKGRGGRGWGSREGKGVGVRRVKGFV